MYILNLERTVRVCGYTSETIFLHDFNYAVVITLIADPFTVEVAKFGHFFISFLLFMDMGFLIYTLSEIFFQKPLLKFYNM